MPDLLLLALAIVAIVAFDVLALRFGVDSRDWNPNARDISPSI